jgi:hypothetical protein
MCELALELGMPVGELGFRMSNYELNVVWPAFFKERQRVRQIEQDRQESEAKSRRRML